MEQNPILLDLAPGLVAKLIDLLIAEDDLRATIEQAESTGKIILDPKTGHRIAHSRLGNVTYWVEYARDGDRCRVHNAYNHRMRVGEG